MALHLHMYVCTCIGICICMYVHTTNLSLKTKQKRNTQSHWKIVVYVRKYICTYKCAYVGYMYFIFACSYTTHSVTSLPQSLPTLSWSTGTHILTLTHRTNRTLCLLSLTYEMRTNWGNTSPNTKNNNYQIISSRFS